MKNYSCLLLVIFSFGFWSCEKENEVPMETYEIAVPVKMSMADFRAQVKVEEPKEIEQSGKIYVFGNYIFINDDMKGILVIDNTYFSPQKVAYIKIPQNTDMAVKGNILFANSGKDLVSFDISNIQDIQVKERLDNVFESQHYPTLPEGVFFSDFSEFNPETEVITGYTIETREREIGRGIFYDTANNLNSGESGTGGSMARFNIAGDHLYTVGRSVLQVFDISDLSRPNFIREEQVGWDIETIFHQDEYLYLGSARGMFIYSIEDPSTPIYMSQIQHVQGCDPVVVAGDLAYVTLRGGNLCGQEESQLQVIDVSDKRNPLLLQTYEMESPYGLGVRDHRLFVCEGASGLKVFDAANSPDLVLEEHFKELEAYDVIPLEDVLLLIGGGVLRQYSYKNDQVNLMNTFNLY